MDYYSYILLLVNVCVILFQPSFLLLLIGKFRWLIVYMSQMYPIPGVSPEISWPENYICNVYCFNKSGCPVNISECYVPTTLF